MKDLFKRLFRRTTLDAEARQEIESHIEMRAELNRKNGMPEDDAMRDARVRFGNSASIREDIYRFNGFAVLDALERDIRAALQTMRRYPSVTALALLSLTLGIGANTLAFTFLNALLFRDLPYPHAEQLLIADDPFTPEECLAVRDRGKAIFEGVGCFVDARPVAANVFNEAEGSSPAFVVGHRFSPEMSSVLGVQPQLGRWFSEDDDTSVVISHSFWQSRLGGVTDVLGRRIRIDDEAFTIVGVMPSGFGFLAFDVEFWAPLRKDELAAQHDSRILGTVVRLAPGATVAQAQSLLDALMSARPRPADEANKRVQFAGMNDFTRGQLQDFALAFQGTVLFVLLIACANVAGLLLAQAVAQQGQFAVRAAIGSGPWRILRQLLVHSLVLFSAGGICGLIAGWVGVRLMVNVVLPYAVDAYGEPRGGIPRGILEAGLDSRVFLFTFALALLCGLAAAIAPMLQVLRSQPLAILRESTENATSGIGRQRLRSVFVSMQIALALTLLVGAALMLKGMRETLSQDVGFEPKALLSVKLRLSDSSEARTMSERMRLSLVEVDGVASATAIAISPPLSGVVTLPLEFDGVPSEGERAQFLPILPAYFETLGVTVVQGREFSPSDGIQSTPVAVINEAAASRYWPNQNPLGKLVRFRSPRVPTEPPRTVIGVVGEVSQYSGQRTRPQVYLPYSQVHTAGDAQLRNQLRDMTFIVRTPRPPVELTSSIGRAIDDVDRGHALSVRTMQQTMFAGTQRRGVIVAVFGLMGSIAVVLAVIGVYGMMSNMVSQRFNELGIRITIGAEPYQIRRLVIWRGSYLIGIGLLVGIVFSLALTRMIRGLLFGASATDPVAFGLGIVLLGGAAFLASYLPALRASRINPITALRRH